MLTVEETDFMVVVLSKSTTEVSPGPEKFSTYCVLAPGVTCFHTGLFYKSIPVHVLFTLLTILSCTSIAVGVII